ncbi:MAG TPA: substrate-binding domain-containing protein [Solirubrobacteraceae bacterium]|nr:substrate-binding domain-containing protein [Solirubrobacteraceae bacterium]
MTRGGRATGWDARLSARLLATGCAAVLSLAVAACGDDDGDAGADQQITIGLITKQETNPYWVTMREVAEQTAEEHNVQLLTAAGKSDVDNESQVAALQYMSARDAAGILIAPADSEAVVPAIEEAREEGVTVIAVDTPTEPRSAVDALFATDNRQAGELIGRYARAKAEAQDIQPRVAMLELAPDITSGELRHDGFLEGLGLEEGDPRIVGSVNTEGDRAKGRRGMEQLLEGNPDINIVYAVNEPAAFGAAAALEAAGKDEGDVILVTVDGGCDAIKRGIRPGVMDATAQQYPENMAREGVRALVDAARGGEEPSGYLNTGVELITGNPVEAVESRNTAFGVRNCWG